jgi:hypothetical protein
VVHLTARFGMRECSGSAGSAGNEKKPQGGRHL